MDHVVYAKSDEVGNVVSPLLALNFYNVSMTTKLGAISTAFISNPWLNLAQTWCKEDQLEIISYALE